MVVLIVAIVVIVWLVAGAIMVSSSATVEPPPRLECYVCKKLDNWWNSLDVFGKIVRSAWYGINKLACIAKDCK